MKTHLRSLLSLLGLFLSLSLPLAAQEIKLHVDATDAPRNLLHITEAIPVTPGELTLFYPKWIPGEHGPTGPNTDLASLHITASGKRVAWRRASPEMNAIKVAVPLDAKTLELSFDFILPSASEGFSSGASSTSRLLVLSWNQVVLYPAGKKSDAITLTPSVRLPGLWKFATALTVREQNGALVHFAPVSLEKLVDSPLSTSAHLRRIELTPTGMKPAVFLNIAADSEESLAIPPTLLESYRKMIPEARALFGGTHYDRYEFLYTLSDHIAHFGLEHHESSDDRTGERVFLDEENLPAQVFLLPHEYAHSWNGKYRRPAAQVTGDFSTAYNNELIWVYEGLTSYLEVLLGTRCGASSIEDGRESLAYYAAVQSARPGRTWRSLQDVCDEAQLLYEARSDYATLRRSAGDFYLEGALLWMEADVMIRQLSKGSNSLDDFCRAFFGGVGSPEVKPYTADEVFSALNSIVAHDWKAHFQNRLSSLNPQAPLGGIEQSGWRLAFKDKPSTLFKASCSIDKINDQRYSLGLIIKADDEAPGIIVDVISGSPAAQAGLVPGMQILAVDGRKYSTERLATAMKDKTTATAPLEIMVEHREFFTTHRIDYHGGEKFPYLERDETKPDLLTQILSPLVTFDAEKGK